MSKLFGGTDDSSQKAQIRQNQQVLALQEKLAKQARGDVLGIFPGVRQSAQEGFQGALDVFGQAVPQQAGLFQGGNVAAQNTLLAGLPQQNNAIMGMPIDLSGLQATELPFNTNFIPQGLPTRAALPAGTAANGGQQTLAQLLGGLGL